jgi:hypothetical protein
MPRVLPKCPRCGERWHDGDPMACARAIMADGWKARHEALGRAIEWYEDACQKVREKYPDRPDLWDQLMPKRVPGVGGRSDHECD